MFVSLLCELFESLEVVVGKPIVEIESTVVTKLLNCFSSAKLALFKVE